MDAEFWVKTAIQFIIAAFAAAAGALSAFKSQEDKEAEKEKTKRIASINLCILSLKQQIEFYGNHYKDYLAKHKSHPHRWSQIVYLEVPITTMTTVPFDEINWILEKGAASLYAKLCLRQDRYNSYFQAVSAYSMYRKTIIDPVADSLHKITGEMPLVADMSREIGDIKIKEVEDVLEYMYEYNPADLIEISELLKEIRVFAKVIYPNGDFINLQIDA